MLLKNTFFSINIILLFLTFIQDILPFNYANYSDEVLLINSTIILIIYNVYSFIKKGRILKIFLVFIVIILYSIINYFLSPFSDSFLLMFLQVLNTLQIFIIALAFLFTFEKTYFQLKVIRFAFYLTFLFFIIPVIMNYFLGPSWNNFFDAKVDYRFGVLRPVGILSGASNVGDYFIITLTAMFFIYKSNFIYKKPFTFLILFIILDFIGIYIFTVRKPLLMLLPIILFIRKISPKFLFIKRISSRLSFGIFLFFLGVISTIIIFTQKGEMLSVTKRNFIDITSNEDTKYIRAIMLKNGIDLFGEFFPIGTSPATFGSNLSQLNTLEAYEYTGISKMGRFTEEKSMSGVFDAGIGSLLAEYGFIGFCLIIMFILYNLKYIKEKYGGVHEVYKILVIYIILNTFFGPGLMSSYLSIFFVLNFLFLLTKRDNRKEFYESIANK